jgi:hypothetical protein
MNRLLAVQPSRKLSVVTIQTGAMQMAPWQHFLSSQSVPSAQAVTPPSAYRCRGQVSCLLGGVVPGSLERVWTIGSVGVWTLKSLGRASRRRTVICLAHTHMHPLWLLMVLRESSIATLPLCQLAAPAVTMVTPRTQQQDSQRSCP